LYLTDYFDENNEDISLKGSEEYSFDTNDENNSIENPLFNNKDVLDSVIDSSFFNDY
jgi:hypothetical protein